MASILLNKASMLPFGLTLALLWVLKDLNMLNSVAKVSHWAHSLCQDHVGISSDWWPIYSALFCGSSVYEQKFFLTLKTLGIVHLFVLSGAHIVFMERLLMRVTSSRRQLFLSLFAMTLMTGFKAPAVRALTAWCSNELNLRAELNWPRSLTAAITGLLCLGLNPHWWLGLSLPLSWVASLSFQIFPKSNLKSLATVYLLGLPLLSSLDVANPFAIIINLIFSPIFFTLHFPISWLAGFVPALQSLVDPLWSLSFWVLDLFKVPLSFELQPVLNSPESRWAYVFSIQGFCYFRERFS